MGIFLVDLPTGSTRRLSDVDVTSFGMPYATVLRSPGRTRTLIARGTLNFFDGAGNPVSEVPWDGRPIVQLLGWTDEAHVLVLTSDSPEDAGLTLVSPDGTRSPLAASNEVAAALKIARDVRLSSDGTRLTVMVPRSADFADNSFDILVLDARTARPVGTIEAVHANETQWMRDGRLVVYGSDTVTVYGADLAVRSTRALQARLTNLGPWSADEVLVSRLVPLPGGAVGASKAERLPLTSGDLAPVWIADFANGYFALSPAGNEVAFETNVGLEVGQRDGGERRLIRADVTTAQPLWW